MTRKGQPVLRAGTGGALVARQSPRTYAAWRLDVREEVRGGQALFGSRKRAVRERGRGKLLHYIAAGGMRQLRRTAADDASEARRHGFLLFLGAAALLWLVFYLVPCG